MDELLMSRVKQLKEIEERLERLALVFADNDEFAVQAVLHQLRLDVQDMVRKAEAEHEAF